MELFAINAGHFKLDGGAMFGVVPKSIWNKLNAADENNLCSWAMRCLLVKDGKKLILVDTGMGDKQDAKFFGHYFLHGEDSLDKSLAQYGFTKDDITDVVLTHLHFDHCGGSIVQIGEKLLPAFKYATYWSNEQHWNWATSPNDREKASFLKENILPIQNSGQLKMIEIPATAGALSETVQLVPSGIIDDLQFIVANGHTNSMMLPVITRNGKTIVFMADLLPSIAHLPLPYVMAYDMFPLITLKEKKQFLNWAIEQNATLVFEHDPVHECCDLELTEKGIRAKSTFPISSLQA